MERIRLTKREKRVLRTLCVGSFDRLSTLDHPAVSSLSEKGLVMAVFQEGHATVDARLSEYGKEYLAEYPGLNNPVNWAMVGAIAAIGALVASVIALFIACGSVQWDTCLTK